jgi:hypothetical protein
MDELALESLAKRVERLERVNRWLGLRMVLVVLGLAWLVWALTRHGVVEARRFILLDAQGSPRAVLGMSSAGSHGGKPSIGILDPRGKVRASLGYLWAKAFGMAGEGPCLML